MYIWQSNLLIELLIRVRYFSLRYLQRAEPINHVEYHRHRWYRLDRHGQVIKVAKTYFDVMQPY